MDFHSQGSSALSPHRQAALRGAASQPTTAPRNHRVRPLAVARTHGSRSQLVRLHVSPCRRAVFFQTPDFGCSSCSCALSRAELRAPNAGNPPTLKCTTLARQAVSKHPHLILRQRSQRRRSCASFSRVCFMRDYRYFQESKRVFQVGLLGMTLMRRSFPVPDAHFLKHHVECLFSMSSLRR